MKFKPREQWRIVVLVILMVSSIAVLAPIGQGEEGPTTLEYGLELSGGTRIRAPLVGITATDVAIEDARTVENDVAAELDGVEITDVNANAETGTVELYSDAFSHAEFAQALRAAGVDATEANVRDGVTAETRETALEVLQTKVSKAGLSGTTVQSVQTGDEHFVLIEAPNENRSEVIDLIDDRGVVRIVAHYPTQQDGEVVYENRTVLTQGDFREIAPAEQPAGFPPAVPVVVKGDVAASFTDSMNDLGFTNEGVGVCRWNDNPDDAGYCLYTVLDGEVVYAASMGADLADDLRAETWENNPQFRMTTTNMSDARELQVNLQAGALPTELDIDGGTTFFIEPSLASEFKLFSLITGIVAVFAVAGTVYLRYGEPMVAIPMVVTALTEVVLLLGFASLVGLSLDLSHIAGLIAVIGTGVDDLIIIADEILQSGDVKTGRVFRNRFRKALWVIGAAAATTIIAMAPLAYLSLGDLRGFAIITIVGVLLGVIVTRPAYGDILRMAMVED